MYLSRLTSYFSPPLAQKDNRSGSRCATVVPPPPLTSNRLRCFDMLGGYEQSSLRTSAVIDMYLRRRTFTAACLCASAYSNAHLYFPRTGAPARAEVRSKEHRNTKVHGNRKRTPIAGSTPVWEALQSSFKVCTLLSAAERLVRGLNSDCETRYDESEGYWLRGSLGGK
jgi:hypothetical protein